ncbi:MAG: methyltransferase domain-containing protein [Patescibacteria group bacterium]
MADSQKASWEIAAKPRAKNRSRYAGGPGAGPDIMRIYSEFFVQAEDGRTSLDVLVLGATPELRDLTLERGHRVTTVDLSEKILADMTELLKARDDTREMRIVGNWLQLPLPDASIDIVVGDAIGNNIEFTNHHRLYGGIRTVLKSGGAFVCREVLGMCDSKRLTLVESIDFVHANHLGLFDLFFEVYFCTSDTGWDPRTQSISLEKTECSLHAQVYGKNLLTPEEEEFLKEFVHGSIVTTFPPFEEWKKTVQRHFSISEMRHATDFQFCSYFPHILLRPWK